MKICLELSYFFFGQSKADLWETFLRKLLVEKTGNGMVMVFSQMFKVLNFILEEA